MVSDLFRSLNKELLPLPTGLKPDLSKLPDIRAVVFDIYGTLIISAAGDISLADGAKRGHFIREAIERETTFELPPGDSDDSIAAVYLEGILNAQNDRRAEGVEFPEVDICEVWDTILDEYGAPQPPEVIELIAARYECLTNPVWPMPHLKDILAALQENETIELGIVSNAQFYTLEMFPAFLEGAPLPELGFSDDLQVYSYRLKEGKPSTRLYETLVENLAKRGIEPAQALFVGNDMRNDIWPAATVGMKTALFAGDARSLRLREDDPRVADVKPDITITELTQLLECLVP